MSGKRTCGNCLDWRETGVEDSGIEAFGGGGSWCYRVGVCESQGVGLDVPRGTSDLPEWQLGCTAWRKRR